MNGSPLTLRSNSNARRYSLGIDPTRDKLIEQGIQADHFHEHFALPRVFSPRPKAYEIHERLQDHRIGPEPTRPTQPARDAPADIQARFTADLTARRQALHDIGASFVTINDEMPLPNLVATTAEDGITCSIYRIACRALGGVDADMGVHSVEPADWGRVLDAFGDRAVVAASYLDDGQEVWGSKALEDGGPLPSEFWQRLAEYLAPLHQQGDRDMNF